MGDGVVQSAVWSDCTTICQTITLLAELEDGDRLPANETPSYPWIRRIHRYWIIRFDIIVGLCFGGLMLLSTLAIVGLAIAAFFIELPIFNLILIYLAVCFVLFCAGMTQYFLLHNLIRCPKCGFNPTRRKSDGRRMSHRIMNPRLVKLEECPECEFRGE